MLDLAKLLIAGKAPKQLYWIFGLGVLLGGTCGVVVL